MHVTVKHRQEVLVAAVVVQLHVLAHYAAVGFVGNTSAGQMLLRTVSQVLPVLGQHDVYHLQVIPRVTTMRMHSVPCR